MQPVQTKHIWGWFFACLNLNKVWNPNAMRSRPRFQKSNIESNESAFALSAYHRLFSIFLHTSMGIGIFKQEIESTQKTSCIPHGKTIIRATIIVYACIHYVHHLHTNFSWVLLRFFVLFSFNMNARRKKQQEVFVKLAQILR